MCAALCLLGVIGRAQGVDRLSVGMWIKAKGALDAAGEFQVETIDVTAPGDENVLTGTVERMISPTRFLLLGQEIRVDSTTRWRGMGPGELSGARVKVEGDYKARDKFVAEVVARRDAGRDAIEGRIDELWPEDDGVRFRVLHYRFRAAGAVPVAFERPPEETELAPQQVYSTTPTAQRDEDDNVRGLLSVGDFVFGGLLEYERRERQQQDLDAARPDDRVDTQMSVRLEAVWEPSERYFALAQVRWIDQMRRDQDDPDVHDADVRLGEAYLYGRDLFASGWDLQVGRQDFDERREWVYDQNVDAVRLIRSTPSWRLELSASTFLSDASQADEDRTNWIAYLSNNDFERHLATYVVHRHEREFGADATHVGVRAFGNWFDGFDTWIEAAVLRGDDATGATVSGYGIDVGGWTSMLDERAWCFAGWAFGSGANSPDGTFRQTGLHGNTDRFGGVTTYRYYGELFDPELSNMSILTLGVGTQLGEDTSLDLALHRYDQVEAVASLADSGIRRTPDGVHRALGWEVDLVLGCRAIDGLNVEAVAGWFEPDDALPGDDAAWLTRIQLRYAF